MPQSTSTRNQKKSITLFLPANLNINALNVTLTGRPGVSALTKGVCYLYHYILKQSCNSHKEVEFEPSFVQVPCWVLRSLLGNSYVETIELLLHAGYLERLDVNPDGEHIPGGYHRPPVCRDRAAKRFRIPSVLRGEERQYVRKEEKVGKAILNKFKALSAPKGLIPCDPEREHVRRMMQQIVLLDSLECREVVERLAAEQRISHPAALYFDLFNHSPFRLVVIDIFGGRAHSEVVNSPKPLRPSMRFRDRLDDQLVEIDLVNSQPALFASITPALINRFAPECAAAIPLFKAVKHKEDYQRYQRLCFDGGFYEYLQTEFNRAYEGKLLKPLTRDDAKNIFYVAAFSNYCFLAHQHEATWEKKRDDAIQWGEPDEVLRQAEDTLHAVRSYQLLERLFPSLVELFAQLKQLDWTALGCEKKHAANCLLVQRIESGLIFNVLVKALLAAGIEYVVTLHDALFLREVDAVKARKIVKEELNKLSLKLKLKAK
ncbi:hypothetical protein I2I05_18645 [Hymenobacter sp. BT683]|uniref:DNA-directed DNA polymerase family A palm domain-containing protein n=1 Tax=Hymenobacter jeongseonensis TaxID=2791027 RepID=A0ABS0IM16_9BACT|nr:hypothetical protein [Hymenobacter jeongseonensis]MBF9239418.1 hypothetical protein [Hymenobacter jeongseonensis]